MRCKSWPATALCKGYDLDYLGLASGMHWVHTPCRAHQDSSPACVGCKSWPALAFASLICASESLGMALRAIRVSDLHGHMRGLGSVLFFFFVLVNLVALILLASSPSLSFERKYDRMHADPRSVLFGLVGLSVLLYRLCFGSFKQKHNRARAEPRSVLFS